MLFKDCNSTIHPVSATSFAIVLDFVHVVLNQGSIYNYGHAIQKPENSVPSFCLSLNAATGCGYFSKKPEPSHTCSIQFSTSNGRSASFERTDCAWLAESIQRYNTLNQHVRTALQNNFNLQSDAQQLAAAITSAKTVNANLYPDLKSRFTA